jgi:hypothetical protein
MFQISRCAQNSIVAGDLVGATRDLFGRRRSNRVAQAD